MPQAEKPRFLRLLIWLVASIYPTFTYGDYPQRWAPTAAAELVASTDAQRETLWLWLETQIDGPYILGETFSVLDIYLTVMITWRPREPWFAQHTPKLFAAAPPPPRTPGIGTHTGRKRHRTRLNLPNAAILC